LISILRPTEGRWSRPAGTGENIINSEAEILLSQDLVEAIVDEMGAGRFSTEQAGTGTRQRLDAVAWVMRNLKIDIPKNSNIIAVTFDAPNPVLAKDVLSRLMDKYLRKHDEAHRAVGAFEFLSKQTDEIRSRLAETEESLRKVKSSAGVTSVDETKTLAVARVKELQQSIEESEAAMAAAEARAQMLRGRFPSATTTVATASVVASNAVPVLTNSRLQSEETLRDLRRRESELLATYTEGSIPVTIIRNRIAALQGQIGEWKMPSVAAESPHPFSGEPSPLADLQSFANDEANAARAAGKDSRA